ncbi:hypothetical protein EVAR_19463_1 [Eumeta japonica]|uniref:Uncharacterized protein n=1 Tax=Eumeta variegata TaxID=151549 RepID=A0A4C1V912_EUMVA|nr:hypothetical protein EVAR_19463_1 [Eumeta japonica]
MNFLRHSASSQRFPLSLDERSIITARRQKGARRARRAPPAADAANVFPSRPPGEIFNSFDYRLALYTNAFLFNFLGVSDGGS